MTTSRDWLQATQAAFNGVQNIIDNLARTGGPGQVSRDADLRKLLPRRDSLLGALCIAEAIWALVGMLEDIDADDELKDRPGE